MTAKWTRRGTYGSSGGEKWEVQIGNAECVVDGLGESWSWKVSTIEGKYREKSGEAKTKEEAMKRAEKAAVLIGGAKMKESHNTTLARLQDDGKLPSDIVRELIYGRTRAGAALHEQEDMPSSDADAKSDEEPMDGPSPEDVPLPPLTHNQIAYFLDNEDAVAEFDPLIAAFDAAQIEYTIEDIESGETVITWPEDQNDQVDQTLAGLGVETYTEEEIIGTATDMIEAVVAGADAFLLAESLDERCKSKKSKHPVIAASEMGEGKFSPSQALVLDKKTKDPFYVDECEEGWGVFGSESGFCYDLKPEKTEAEKAADEKNAELRTTLKK